VQLGEQIMTKSDHHKPINFVGLYFIDEEGYETGQIIAEISDGYYLACRRRDWKYYPPSSSTRSATVVWSATLAILCQCRK
jgi:hypothetical protein